MKSQLSTSAHACIPTPEANVVAPLMYELGRSQTSKFYFFNGTHEVPGFPGLEGQHQGPFFRYFDKSAPDITQVASSIQALPTSATSPEEFCRTLMHMCGGEPKPQIATSLVQSFATNSDLGPFDGLLGFSEGASVAATIALEQERVSTRQRFKCAVFICGSPPLRERGAEPYLADECGQCIKIPTLHIVGANDPGMRAGLALFNLCTNESATLYDHGQGHEIPRAPAITKRMAQLIREMVARVENNSPPENGAA